MEKLSTEYWDEHFRENNTPWDAGSITPPIKAYADQLRDKSIAILIPGCGNSHEADYLLEQGFTNITVIDLSPTLTEKLREKFEEHIPSRLKVITGNFFDLEGSFDLVVEQTFFCALDPSLRKNYVEKMHTLLKPGGKIAGLLFNRDFDENPPFGGSKEVYYELFSPYFDIKIMEPCYNSLDRRSGTELFIIVERK